MIMRLVAEALECPPTDLIRVFDNVSRKSRKDQNILMGA
jgi:hypothetical protein